MSTRMAAVLSHPIQHFAPMFRDLAAQAGMDLKVFYCCDWGVKEYRDPGFGRRLEWDVPLLEGYVSEFLPIRRRPRDLSFYQIDNPTVGRELEEFAPRMVWLHGYSHRTSWRVHKWARSRGVRILYFGDSELLHRRSVLSRVVKRAILPRFFRRCDAFLTIGDNNEQYYRHYGVPDSKMFRGAYPVDVGRFRRAVDGMPERERSAVRERFGLAAEGVVVMFVGKFIAMKRPLDLVEAVARLTDIEPRVQALFVGDGGLRNAIEARVSQLQLAEHVRIAGFINQSEMPTVLAAGDVLAMCSETDPHPLAVTEAMAVGKAVVASDRVGCVGPTDAARPGVNTLVYPCGDVGQLADRLRTLAEDPDLRARMSVASRELALTQNTSVTVSAVLRAAESFAVPTGTHNQ